MRHTVRRDCETRCGILAVLLGLAVCLGLALPTAAPAQTAQESRLEGRPGSDLGVVPIKVVNGHLVVLTDLVGLQFTNEASFEISLEYPDALTLHPDQYGWVGIDQEKLKKGEEQFVHILIQPGIKWTINVRDVVPEPSKERVAFQNSMTKLYSTGLGERKLKGTIGVNFLKRYHVTLDVGAQQMVLAAPRVAGDPSPSMDLADLTVTPFEYRDNQIRIGVNYADNRASRLVLGGTEYDTFIDAGLAKALQKPAGNVTPVWLVDSANADRRLDLSRYMAFRPKALPTQPEHPDGAILRTGVNLLESFRVELDWTNRTIGFTQKQIAQYPQQDFDFFVAEHDGTADAVQAYLERYPKVRLSYEAANLLVARRVAESASDERVMQALRWVVDTAIPGRRAEDCERWVGQFKTLPDRSALTIAAAQEGLKYSREAIGVTAVYALHNALGEQFMAAGDLDQAWKHFLSSAFMTPDDIMTSVNLARVYDKQGRARRAYSRYRRVAASRAASEELKAEATAAMARLAKALPSDDPLLVP